MGNLKGRTEGSTCSQLGELGVLELTSGEDKAGVRELGQQREAVDSVPGIIQQVREVSQTDGVGVEIFVVLGQAVVSGVESITTTTVANLKLITSAQTPSDQ